MWSWFETTFSNHFPISTTVILFEKNYCKLVESRNFPWIGISQSGEVYNPRYYWYYYVLHWRPTILRDEHVFLNSQNFRILSNLQELFELRIFSKHRTFAYRLCFWSLIELVNFVTIIFTGVYYRIAKKKNRGNSYSTPYIPRAGFQTTPSGRLIYSFEAK